MLNVLKVARLELTDSAGCWAAALTMVISLTHIAKARLYKGAVSIRGLYKWLRQHQQRSRNAERFLTF